MTDQLQEILARIKSQNSQTKKPEPKKSPIPPAPKEDEEMIEEAEEEEKPVEKAKEQSIQQEKEMTEIDKIGFQIARLQNNGIYRGEMLYRMDKISDYLMVIADSLSKLTGANNESK